MSPIKEPNFFASEIRPENVSEEFQERVRRDMDALKVYLQGPLSEKRFGGMVLEWEDYLRLFEKVNEEKAVGEASVLYLWSKSAAGNIFSRIPDAKIVMVLRDPAERAFSQYLHNLTNGIGCESFREHIYTASRSKSKKFSVAYPLLELGLYFEQVKRYLDIFPRENVQILFFEDYQKQPARMLDKLFEFLNVDPDLTPDLSRKQLEPQVPRAVGFAHLLKRYGLWQRARDLIPPVLRSQIRGVAFRKRKSLVMDSKDRDYLRDYYRDDIGKLSALLNRDLQHWVT